MLFLLLLYVLLFDCKCKSLKRLGENIKETERNITNNRKNSKENINNRNTGFPAHEPPRKINISKGLAGRFFFLCFLCCPSSCFSDVHVFMCVFRL